MILEFYLILIVSYLLYHYFQKRFGYCGAHPIYLIDYSPVYNPENGIFYLDVVYQNFVFFEMCSYQYEIYDERKDKYRIKNNSVISLQPMVVIHEDIFGERTVSGNWFWLHFKRRCHEIYKFINMDVSYYL